MTEPMSTDRIPHLRFDNEILSFVESQRRASIPDAWRSLWQERRGPAGQRITTNSAKTKARVRPVAANWSERRRSWRELMPPP